MPRNRRKPDPKPKTANPKPIQIDQSDLTNAISDAYREINCQKEKQAIDQENKQNEVWDKLLGRKEFPPSKYKLIDRLHTLRNNTVTIWNFLFIKGEDVRGMRTTFALINITVVVFFTIFEFGLYTGSFVLLCRAAFKKIDWIVGVGGSFVLWLFARIVRIAKYEVEKLKDKELSISLFSASISFSALIVAILALLVAILSLKSKCK